MKQLWNYGSGMMVWVGFLIGFGYIFYMSMGNTSTPSNKPYNKLFNSKTYLQHLSISGILCLYGLYACQNIDARSTMFFAPTSFLIAFFFADRLVQKLTGRHIVMASRGDLKPPYYRWYIDSLCSVLVLFISIVVPGMLMNYFLHA